MSCTSPARSSWVSWCATSPLRADTRAIVAIGVVIRGETPHFDFVAGETARALSDAATTTGVPVGLGLLTCDTMEQAMARAGGSAGNKGREAADAAIRTAHLLQALGTP